MVRLPTRDVARNSRTGILDRADQHRLVPEHKAVLVHRDINCGNNLDYAGDSHCRGHIELGEAGVRLIGKDDQRMEKVVALEVSRKERFAGHLAVAIDAVNRSPRLIHCQVIHWWLACSTAAMIL